MFDDVDQMLGLQHQVRHHLGDINGLAGAFYRAARRSAVFKALFRRADYKGKFENFRSRILVMFSVVTTWDPQVD